MSGERAVAVAGRLADGEWHRLHPATPLLRGGIAVVAIFGVVIGNLRQRIVTLLFHTPDSGDPLDQIYRHGLVGWAILAVVAGLLVILAGCYVSWRMHLVRVGEDAVELRRGLLFRRYRKARLDRIQGVNVARPLFARLFGASKLEVLVAGQDANVELAYLGARTAEGLRRDILALAAGAAMPEDAAAPDGSPAGAGRLAGLVERRFGEITADYAEGREGGSLVRLDPGRLAGSLAFSGFSILVLVALGVVIGVTASGRYWALIAIVPGLIASVTYYTRRFGKAVRYSIVGTEDGVRVASGLLATTSETIPPGRVHALEAVQPVLWRPFGWWQLRINLAGHSRQRGNSGDAATTVLPVGDADDVARVVPLLLPAVAEGEWRSLLGEGLTGRGAPSGDPEVAYPGPPRAAAWLRPFSWRRTGHALSDGLLAFRCGAIRRRLTLVPLARLQSVEATQGPARRALGLAALRAHTVNGPAHPRLPVVGVRAAEGLFDLVAAEAVRRGAADTSDGGGRPRGGGMR